MASLFAGSVATAAAAAGAGSRFNIRVDTFAVTHRPGTSVTLYLRPSARSLFLGACHHFTRQVSPFNLLRRVTIDLLLMVICKYLGATRKMRIALVTTRDDPGTSGTL